MNNHISDYYLWVLFSQTMDAMSKVRERELLTQHISERHAQLLFIIELIGRDATPAKISRWMFREPHSISEIIDRMEKQGLIKKVKDLDRKNQVRIEITQKGRDQYERSFIPNSIPEAMSVLNNEDRKALVAALKKLRKSAVKKLGVKYEVPLPPVEQ